MKRSFLQILSTIALAVVGVLIITAPTFVMAQIPAGVVVDSIAPANNWTNIFPPRAHSLVCDPKTGQMAFIAGTGSGGTNPFWLYSSDDGQSWSSLTGFLPSGASHTAVAADSNFTVYIAYTLALSNGAYGVFFNKDPNGDGSGLGATPVLVNDTSASAADRLADWPDIAVSPDGQNIIITSEDVKIGPVSSGYNAGLGMCRAYVSHDGGATWTMHVIVNPYDSAIKPPNDNPGWTWYGPSVAMGSNGYAFYVISSSYDSSNTATTYWDVVTETNNYGDTWSTPSWITTPPSSEVTIGTNIREFVPALAVGNTPHFTEVMTLPGGQQELYEFHKEGGSWVYHPVTQVDPLTGSYAFGEQGELGVDSQGRLYCFYIDKNISAAPESYDTRQVFVSGSSDGGDTWTPPVRLTDKQFAVVGDSADQHWPSLLRFPTSVADTGVGLFLNGLTPGMFGTGAPVIDAWDEVRFPLSVVWTGPYDHDLTAPKPDGYKVVAGGASVYSWDEISGTGTKITSWYDGPPPQGDAARDDGTAGPFPLGFNFEFYGHSYSHFWVGVNGLISFTDSVLNSAATEPSGIDSVGYYDGTYNFPGKGNPFHTVISAFYNDLVLGPAYVGSAPGNYGHGDAYYWTNPANDTCVIEWHNAGDFVGDQTDTTLNFEVILSSVDSSVSVMYKSLGKDNIQSTAKVGIQAVDSIGVAYVNGSIPASNIPENMTGVKFGAGTVTAITQRPPSIPLSYNIYQNYPNPFNPTTDIAYDLPKNVKVSIKVYNVLGEEVATLLSGIEPAGHHVVMFNASRLASGVYFYRIEAGSFVKTLKMMMLK